MKKILSLVLIILMCFTMSCSVGGGSNSDKKPTASEGTFIDSAVEGLNYKTATQEGTTDIRGKFYYLEGETITFYLADIQLGNKVVAKPLMSPFDLTGGVISENNETATNICRLIQTLDMDGNLDNGIQISKHAIDEIEGRGIDFSLGLNDFTNDIDMLMLLGALNAANVFSDGSHQLRTKDQALRHLRISLGLDDGSSDPIEVPKNTYYYDGDGDGYGNPYILLSAETQPVGYVTDNTDCNDYYDDVHPGATEIFNDGIDQDCDGQDSNVLHNCYMDQDGDGYGNPNIMTQDLFCPSGYVSNNTDCDDTDFSVNPGRAEIYGDGVDQDCDGSDLAPMTTYFRDADGDGYGNLNVTVEAAEVPDGYVENSLDTDDTDPTVP